MKGFIHLVETVVIALVVFVILTQFWYIPGLKSDWERVKLTLLGQDVLLVLDRVGINWLDAKANISALLGNGIIYTLEIVGVPPSNITIGCNCSDEQLNFIKWLVSGMPEINGQRFNFFVERATDYSMAYTMVLTFYQPGEVAIQSFLTSGRGVLEVLPEPNIDNVQQELFGLNSSTGSPTEENLTWAIGPDSGHWLIYQYFHTIPNSTGQTWPEPWEFENFLLEAVVAKNPILVQSGLAGAAVNRFGAGRTGWLGVDFNDLKVREDLQTMLKAMILWTAGESWTVVEGPPGIAAISYYTALNKDFFQPIEIRLKIRYIY